MKKQTLLMFATLTILGILVAGVSPVAASLEQIESEDDIPSVEVTGVVEAINGDQVTVDGQVITVDVAIIESIGFVVGDMVEVKVTTNENGELVAEFISLEDSFLVEDDSEIDVYSSDDEIDDDSDYAISDDSEDDAEDENADGDHEDNHDEDAHHDDVESHDSSGDDDTSVGSVSLPGV